jgi:hypothetical protein
MGNAAAAQYHAAIAAAQQAASQHYAINNSIPFNPNLQNVQHNYH